MDNIDILEVKKEDELKEIENLNYCCDNIEKLQTLMPVNSLSYLKLNAFKKELEKEIEYSDFILQEINDSIDFNACKEDK